MKIAPIVNQILAECPSFKQVAGTISQELLEGVVSQKVLPAAYVVRLDEDAEIAEASEYGNEYHQELTEHFGVVVFLGNADKRGQAAADQLDDLRAELFKALCGWCPSECHDPIEYEGGTLQTLTRDRLIYFFEFKTTTTVTKEDTWQQVAYERLGTFDRVSVDIDTIDLDTGRPDGVIEAKLEIDLTNGA